MKRVVPGLMIAGCWILLLLQGSAWLFCLCLIAVVCAASHEYLKMIDTRKLSFIERSYLIISLSLPVIIISFFPDARWVSPSCIISFFSITGYFLFRYGKISDGLSLYCRLVFGIIYIGILGAHLVLLRFLPHGESWLVIVSAITAGSDSAAYFTGKAIGKRKLSKNISPNKTIEGAAGGIVGGVLFAVIFAFLLLPSFNLFFIIGSAIILTLVGIAGDLTESTIKRGTGTKDSGSILAGHGGILDRVDSLLFAAPVLYYFLIVTI